MVKLRYLFLLLIATLGPVVCQELWGLGSAVIVSI